MEERRRLTGEVLLFINTVGFSIFVLFHIFQLIKNETFKIELTCQKFSKILQIKWYFIFV